MEKPPFFLMFFLMGESRWINYVYGHVQVRKLLNYQNVCSIYGIFAHVEKGDCEGNMLVAKYRSTTEHVGIGLVKNWSDHSTFSTLHFAEGYKVGMWPPVKSWLMFTRSTVDASWYIMMHPPEILFFGVILAYPEGPTL